VGVVEDAEELSPETKLHFLSEMKLALERDVRLRRAARMGSKLIMVSSPNAGTEVTLVVPGCIVF